MPITIFDRKTRNAAPYSVQINDNSSPTVLPDFAYASYVLVLSGSLSAPRDLILPIEVGCDEGWTIENNSNAIITAKSNSPLSVGVAIPAGENAKVYWNGSDFKAISGGSSSAGVTDHGALTGLGDNDHPQYQLAAAALTLTSSTPSAVSTSGAVGTGTTAARADHAHAHGAQTDGTLHAVATTSTPGFLSAADKTKLDGITGVGIAAPTANYQLYNSTAANAASWTTSPTVDTFKANTSIDVGPFLAVAATGNGADDALVAQGGGTTNGNGGYFAVCGGIPSGSGSGGGSGLATRGDVSGLNYGTLCVSAEEVGGRKCAALLCGTKLTATEFPTTAGAGVAIIKRCTTFPTTGPATNYGSIFVGNGTGNNGLIVRSSENGLSYENTIRRSVAASGITVISMGNVAGAEMYTGTPSNYKMGVAMGTLHVSVLGNSSGWTGNGVNQYYWTSGYFVSHYNGSGPSGPWLAYMSNTTLPSANCIVLAVNGTTFEVTLTVTNTNSYTCDVHVYFDWKQCW